MTNKKKLLKAAKRGYVYDVNYRLDSGVDVNAKYEYKPVTPIHHYFRNLCVKDLISLGSDIETKNKSVWFMTRIFIYYNTFYKRYFEAFQGDGTENTPLIYASRKGHLPVVILLLKRGAALEIKNTFGNTALILATIEGHIEVVKILIAAGADVNSSNKWNNNTALHYAYIMGHTDIKNILINAGANIYAKNNENLIPQEVNNKSYFYKIKNTQK